MTVLPRWLAILIAVLAVLDPAVTRNRASRPDIALIANGADDALTDETVRALAERFNVIRAPFGAAAATVLVGDHVPSADATLAGPVFAVLPDATGPSVRITDIRAPRTAPPGSRIPLRATMDVTGNKGRELRVSAIVNGIVMADTAMTIGGDQLTLEPKLEIVLPDSDPAVVRFAARVTGREGLESADVVMDPSVERWRVLFHDPQASWMSTFMRRTIEADARFDVSSRIVTSRVVSTETGSPPPSLSDAAALARYELIVIGSANALGAPDIAGLDTYLRRRGGSVILLLDEPPSSSLDRLTAVTQWSRFTGQTTVAIESAEGELAATQLLWPARLPAVVRVLATSSSPDAAASSRPVIWQAPVGAGRLLVSGALDAWRFRDPATSGFVAFWLATAARMASEASRAIVIDLDRAVVAPGAVVRMRATISTAAIQGFGRTNVVRASAGAVDGGGDPIRLWPARTPGTLTATLRAPLEPGIYRIRATSGDEARDAVLRVLPGAAATVHASPDLVRAVAASMGGTTVTSSSLPSLVTAIESAVRPDVRATIVHPMHSPFWIVPFAFLLALEWWIRRRRGLP